MTKNCVSCVPRNIQWVTKNVLLFFLSSVLAEDAIKAALNDYKVKQESLKKEI